MKKRVLFIFISVLFACDSENAPDCLQTTGELVREEIVVGTFNKIRIEDDVALDLIQGPEQKLIIETGRNLLSDVSVQLEGSTVVIKNLNSCNLIREYSNVKAIITSPNIVEIRNSSIGTVKSIGTLSFPRLYLVSNTTGGIENSRKSGDFILHISCERFEVAANGFSRFFVSGFSEKAVIAFEDEIPLFEGAELIINDLIVFQRSANKMMVNPQQSIRGEIRGTGDIISFNRPPIVNVEEFYTGRLLFQD
jgi:hypothetical protein